MSNMDLWWITLGAGLLVSAVVAVLLVLILRSVRRISDNLLQAWVVGKKVANNTVHIDLLRRTAVVTDDVLANLELATQAADNIRKGRA